MSHNPHELAEEFPESAERLRALKASSAHFAKLCDEYHEVNRQIHRMETNVEPAGEAVEAVMRRKRMMLKDEIYAGLKAGSSETEAAHGKSDD